MDIKGIGNTTGLFLCGTLSTALIVELIIKHTAHESAITLLTTGSILLPLATLIGIATQSIFERFGWKSEPHFWAGLIFTVFSSSIIASGAAVGFGLTASLDTAWKVMSISLELLIGINFFAHCFENIFCGKHHYLELKSLSGFSVRTGL